MISGISVAVLAVFMLCQACAEITTCTFDDSICGCQSDQGPIDLTSYMDDGVQVTSGSTTYYWNPCKDMTKGKITAACIQEVSSSSDYNCGTHASTTTQVTADGHAEFNLHSDDQVRFSYVQCVCASDETYEFVSESPTAHYNLKLTSQNCCPVSSTPTTSSGLSVGSILLILFFSLLLTYMCVGVLIQVFVRKAQGKERFPNIVFWTAIPPLILTGFRFTFTCGRHTVPYDEI